MNRTTICTLLVASAALCFGLTGCTAGRVVNDATNSPIPYIYVRFRNVDTGQTAFVRTDGSGQFAFDPTLTTASANTVKVTLQEGNYEVSTGTFIQCNSQSLADVYWDHRTFTPFKHTYDTTCTGSDGTTEKCEYYQVRVSDIDPTAPSPNPPSTAEPTSDSHTGVRVITVFRDVWIPAPTPC